MNDKSKKIIDPKPIKELKKLLDDLNLTEISYSDGDFSVSVSKGLTSSIASPSSTTKQHEKSNSRKSLIKRGFP